MNYCHWSADSDVYLYSDTAGFIVCCLCNLDKNSPIDRKFSSHSEAIQHIQLHLSWGDNIPEDVMQRLQEKQLYAHPSRLTKHV